MWLARQVSMAPPPFRRGPIVLACGPSDLHSIGLEAYAAILTRRGWSCRVLGAMTPASALVAAAASSRAVAAVVTSQRGVTRRAAVEAIDAVDALPGTRAIYAGDAFATPAGRRGVSGVYLGDDVVDAGARARARTGQGGSPAFGLNGSSAHAPIEPDAGRAIDEAAPWFRSTITDEFRPSAASG